MASPELLSQEIQKLQRGLKQVYDSPLQTQDIALASKITRASTISPGYELMDCSSGVQIEAGKLRNWMLRTCIPNEGDRTTTGILTYSRNFETDLQKFSLSAQLSPGNSQKNLELFGFSVTDHQRNVLVEFQFWQQKMFSFSILFGIGTEPIPNLMQFVVKKEPVAKMTYTEFEIIQEYMQTISKNTESKSSSD